MMKIGSRNLKTAISVFICIIVFQLLKRPYPFYACIAAVICMQNSVHNSFVAGKNRMIGTIIGAVVGIMFSIFIGQNAIVTGLGIVLVIYLCNFFNYDGSVSIACVVFLAIMTNLKEGTSYMYAINRVFDTFVGIIVAILVNKYINFSKLDAE
ncbi:FUSC family protein [Brassicibacter mesophilus]|uniref:FUSC family protein n=1 Tax=Brassicibacter mesophilus TaxID=745119 RepID=UPI003D24A3F3